MVCHVVLSHSFCGIPVGHTHQLSVNRIQSSYAQFQITRNVNGDRLDKYSLIREFVVPYNYGFIKLK